MTQESSSGANAPEEDAETLLREIGRVLLDDAAATAWIDERFAAWLFQSADADLFSHETDRDDAELERLGTALLARIAARRRELRRLHVPPTDLDPPLIATPLRSVDAARVYAAAPVIDLAVAAGTGREIWDEPVRRWVRIPQEVPEGRYVVFPIVGDSLSPLVHSGDQVLVQLDTEPQVGCVVVARHPDDGYVCKVVTRIRARTIELGSLDPSRAPITIPRDPRLLIGTVVVVWCMHGELRDRTQ